MFAFVTGACFALPEPFPEPSAAGGGGEGGAQGGALHASGGADRGGAGSGGSPTDPCADGQKNGTESDVDCGGMCAQCMQGQACGSELDCTGAFCVDGRCCDTACDALCQGCDADGSEGSCAPHPVDSDPEDECGSDVCNGSGACRCNDGAMNGLESDVDCGGAACVGCANGAACAADDDCASGSCAPPCGPWSYRLGSNDNDNLLGVDQDGQGNIVLTGRWIGGEWALATESFATASAQTDGWLALLGRTGDVAWARRFGGAMHDWGEAVAFDAQGNIYLAGRYQGSVNFDGHFTNPQGEYDIFVAKIDPANGAVLWMTDLGSDGNDAPFDIAVSPSGTQIWIAGQMDGDIGALGLTNAGDLDVIVVGLDGAGNVVHSASFGSAGPDIAHAVALDDVNGRVYATGTFSGTVSFGSAALAALAGEDIFVASWDTTLAHRWSARHGSDLDSTTFTDWGRDIAIKDGVVYVTGEVVAGIGSMSNLGGATWFNGAGAVDLFVAKYDDNMDGAHTWSTVHGGNIVDRPFKIAFDKDDNMYVAGITSSTTNFNFDGAGSDIIAVSPSDHFIVKLDANDTYIDHLHLGHSGLASDFRVGLVVHQADDNLVLAGSFQGIFDPGGGPHTSTNNGRDSFIVSLGPML